MYGEPSTELIVPVGEDQVSHVELSREIVRRFNLAYAGLVTSFANDADLYAAATDSGISSAVGPEITPASRLSLTDKITALKAVFRSSSLQERGYYLANGLGHLSDLLTEPHHLVTKTPRIPGTDGRKMSKSYANFISLSESNDSIRTKSRAMITDPARKRRTDPGNPDICPVYDWHKLFSPPDILAWSAEGCRTAGIGCIQCKTAMADNLIKWIEPIRARREEFAAHPDKVLRIIDNRSTKARDVAQKTMSRVREAIFKWKEKREEIAQQKSSAQNAKVGD